MFNLNYYSITRAAKLLECEIDDIIHLWINGYVGLYVELKNIKTKLERYERKEPIERILDTNPYQDISKKMPARWFIPEKCVDTIDTKNSNYVLNIYDGTAFGLWQIIPTLFTMFIDKKIYLFNEYNKKKLSNPTCAAMIAGDYHKGLGYDFIVNDGIIELNKLDLVILKSDFLNIKNNSNGSEFLDKNKMEMIVPFSEDTISYKSLNTRTSFIKSLLFIHYGKDVSDSPRKFMESNDSEILNDFKSKGIKPPSGKTVQSWLEIVDIPFENDK